MEQAFASEPETGAGSHPIVQLVHLLPQDSDRESQRNGDRRNRRKRNPISASQQVDHQTRVRSDVEKACWRM